MRKILKNQLYLKVLLSDLISNFGDTLYFIALMTYVTELKDSKTVIWLFQSSIYQKRSRSYLQYFLELLQIER